MAFERIKRIIKDPRRVIVGLLYRTARIWPDKLYLQLRFFFEKGRILNFKTPRTFCEKMQWLKLYNRNPEYTKMVDKYAVKEYVADKIGEGYKVKISVEASVLMKKQKEQKLPGRLPIGRSSRQNRRNPER